MLVQLAWRNIWRNRRRTLITTASILFAVLFATFMESLQKGAWNNTINNVVNFYVGYAQIHLEGYWDERSLDLAFSGEEVTNLARKAPGVQAVVPRLESYALASTGNNTLVATVIGIDPELEDGMTHLSGRLIAGKYLTPEDQTVLLAAGAAKQLELGVGDTLLLIGQGYHGVNAAGKYPITGIVEFATPELNKSMVCLPLVEAQWLYGADGLVTSLALQLPNQRAIQPALHYLDQQLPDETYEVMDWKAMMPDLLEAKALDSAGNIIVYCILYLIIGFGIFGTILMMIKEREYEFGVLIAIGMRRWRLAMVVWLEIIFLGLLGAMAGILCSTPLVYYFRVNPLRFSGDYASALEKFGFEPIFPTEFRLGIFLTQALVVLAITIVLGLFPFRKLKQLEPVAAMRS
ncbi:MAG: ABC transporter permease [Lewinellaceae bacterium]|nr:ABC transporter permease [Lewinellaceae bacterium]